MLQFSALYRLGRSMGYAYLHEPFSSFRSSASSIRSGLEKGKLATLAERMRRGWYRLFGSDVYGFLGFNRYLSGLADQRARPRNPETVEIELSTALLEEHGVETFEQLQAFVARAVSSGSSHGGPVLARFRLTGRRDFFVLVNESVPEYQDGVDFRNAYFEARRRQPWRSLFEEGKIKVLVHMRQGDTAVLETPWNTLIPLWAQVKRPWVEHGSFEEIESKGGSGLLPVEDYCRFLEDLLTQLGSEASSALVFSDGFKRAFSRVYANMDRLKLSDQQIRELAESEKDYDRRAFRGFEHIEGSRLVVGEGERKLRDLIHSVIHSDIVIIGPQQRMFPKFFANYCDASNMPAVFVLFRGARPNYEALGLRDREDRFVYVDMDSYDGRTIASALSRTMGLEGGDGEA